MTLKKWVKQKGFSWEKGEGWRDCVKLIDFSGESTQAASMGKTVAFKTCIQCINPGSPQAEHRQVELHFHRPLKQYNMAGEDTLLLKSVHGLQRFPSPACCWEQGWSSGLPWSCVFVSTWDPLHPLTVLITNFLSAGSSLPPFFHSKIKSCQRSN